MSTSTKVVMRRSRHDNDGRSSERAFTVIELIVAMLLITLVLGFLIVRYDGAQTASAGRRAGEAAAAYASAVTQFRNERGGRAPQLGDANDWPDARTGPIGLAGVALMDEGAPELVEDGIAGVDGTLDGAKGEGAAIVYERMGTTTWLLSVHVRDGNAWPLQCQLGTAPRTVREC